MDHAQSLAVADFKDELDDVMVLLQHMVEGSALDRQYNHEAVTFVFVQVCIVISNFVLYLL